MSTICGIVHFDARPVDEGDLRKMAEASADRCPDGRSLWIDGNIGFGHGALNTTSEGSREHQPWVVENPGLCICFAGRLDNRIELGELLGSGERLARVSDAGLVGRAFASWEEGFVDRLRGDFALAVWDRSSRRLFCVRDPIGARPFYYHLSSSSFYFASELRQLLALQAVPRRPNEGMLGEYLVSQMVNKSETLFEGIFRLPPGSSLEVRGRRLRHWTFWPPAEVPSVRYRRDEEYVEHLRELLWRSVEARLRSDRPVGIQLSGGVDSSSVVAVAADLQRTGRLACPGLESFSLVFPGWDCDESEFIERVAAKTGVRSHFQRPVRSDPKRYAHQVARYLDVPDYPNGSMSDPLERGVQERDIRVLLTGLGGDEWFQRPDLHLADLLRRGRWLQASQWVRSLPGRSWSPIRQHPLISDGIMPLIPDVVRAWLRRNRLKTGVPDWIHSDFARRTSLSDRLRQPLDRRRYGSLERAGSLLAATQGFQTHAIEMEERSAAAFHLELRYPFHDRRVVEFGWGLPAEQRWRNGFHKFLLREVMRGHLPDEVRSRRSKAEFSRVFVEALLAVGRRGFENLTIAEAGWVDLRVVLAMFDRVERRFRQGGECRGRELWPLWSVFGCELWFCALFRSGNLAVAIG